MKVAIPPAAESLKSVRASGCPGPWPPASRTAPSLNSPSHYAMCPADPSNLDQLAVARLLDANLDRAREGLRVLEDWARFGVDRADLVARTKDMRQRLGRLHRDDYKLARHTATDPAAGMGHPAQQERLSPSQIVGANAGRVHEALRVLEEFGRSIDPELASEAAALRYGLYDLEVDLLQASRAASSAGSSWPSATSIW